MFRKPQCSVRCQTMPVWGNHEHSNQTLCSGNHDVRGGAEQCQCGTTMNTVTGPYVQGTTMCGAVPNNARVATTVNTVKARRHSLSRTMAANFQSFFIMDDFCSLFILSVMTLSSLRIMDSSLIGEGVAPSLSVAGPCELVRLLGMLRPFGLLWTIVIDLHGKKV